MKNERKCEMKSAKCEIGGGLGAGEQQWQNVGIMRWVVGGGRQAV